MDSFKKRDSQNICKNTTHKNREQSLNEAGIRSSTQKPELVWVRPNYKYEDVQRSICDILLCGVWKREVTMVTVGIVFSLL